MKQEPELLENLLKAIKENLKHEHPYVRKNAVLAVASIYRLSEDLLPDAPELIEAMLLGVRFFSVLRSHSLLTFSLCFVCLGARSECTSQCVFDVGAD